jgi:hypothetical protein
MYLRSHPLDGIPAAETAGTPSRFEICQSFTRRQLLTARFVTLLSRVQGTREKYDRQLWNGPVDGSEVL